MKTTNTCWKCKYFQITHQPSRPYGCIAMGFKSKRLPCFEVVSVDGKDCLSFYPKSVDDVSENILRL